MFFLKKSLLPDWIFISSTTNYILVAQSPSRFLQSAKWFNTEQENSTVPTSGIIWFYATSELPRW